MDNMDIYIFVLAGKNTCVGGGRGGAPLDIKKGYRAALQCYLENLKLLEEINMESQHCLSYFLQFMTSILVPGSKLTS